MRSPRQHALSLAVIIVITGVHALMAQVAVKIEPTSVDAASPPSISLTASPGVDRDRLKAADHAMIDGSRVPVQATVNGVTLTPPPLPPGTKTIQLQDAANAVLAIASVEYSAMTTDKARNTLAQPSWFYSLVTMLFVATVLPFAAAIVASVWRGQSGQTTTPLGLPEGTVRAVLAFSFVVYLGVYVLANALCRPDLKPPDFLTGVVATVVGFYFGSRSSATARSSDTASGAAAGAITGTLSDANGTGVSGAAVILARKGAPAAAIKRATTDAAGAFTFSVLDSGTYTLTATSGASTAVSDVTVSGGSVTTNLKF